MSCSMKSRGLGIEPSTSRLLNRLYLNKWTNKPHLLSPITVAVVLLGCIDGYFGHECQSVCLCAMGTTCNTVTGCPKCMALGLTGGNCQTDVDECNVTANICGANSACRNLVGSYSCICDDWYVRGTNSCQGRPTMFTRDRRFI
jgi:Calcium-binding EGF domain